MDSFDSSIFKRLVQDFDDADIVSWCDNVLSKLQGDDILPKAMERSQEDRVDFDSLWSAISCFFSLIVAYSRKFESFNDNDALIELYLIGRDLGVHNNTTSQQLKDLMNKYYTHINRRATAIDLYGQGDLYRVTSHVQGELLLNAGGVQCSGWLLGKNSPLYRGVTIYSQLNKLWPVGQNEDINTAWPVQSGSIAQSIVDYENILSLSGGTSIGGSDSQYNIHVSQSLSYQISFLIKGSTSVTVGCIGASGGLTANIDSGEWRYVRVNIYGSNATNTDPTTTMNVGSNMTLNSNVVIPQISVTSSCEIKHLLFSPLFTDYGKGFVGGQQIAQSWITNNSGLNSDNVIEQLLRHSYTPYSMGFKNQFV